MDGILEQQQAIFGGADAHGNYTTIELPGASEAITVRITYGNNGITIEQGTDIIWLPNAAAVDALIEALGGKRRGMV